MENFEKNQENIKECIRKRMSGNQANVDDMPYVIGLAMDIPLDLHKEYKGILKMYKEGDVSIPVKAFFGELLERPRRTGAYPMALLNRKVNIDQLLAIHNAMKYPVAYIQGPPGTGKTNTFTIQSLLHFLMKERFCFLLIIIILLVGCMRNYQNYSMKERRFYFRFSAWEMHKK